MRVKWLLIVAFASHQCVALASPPARGAVDENKARFSDERGNNFTIYRNLIEDKGDGRVQVWLQTDLARPVQSTAGMVKSLKTLEQYDCNRRLHRTLYVTSYDARGSSLRGNESEQTDKPVIPGTVGELEFAMVCKFAGYETKNSFQGE